MLEQPDFARTETAAHGDGEAVRLAVLRLQLQRPEISQRELSQAMGLSLGKTHYVLRALLDRGLVKAGNFRRSGNKLAYTYMLNPTGLREKLRLTRAFLQRKEAEYEQLRHTIASQRTQRDCMVIAARQVANDPLRAVLSAFPQIVLAVLFGSFAAGHQRPESDIDIAVAARRALTASEKMALIEALAEQTGRPIGLVDLRMAGEPLLGQILRHGRRLLGSDREYGQLISRHLFEQADFMPYRARVLAQRRAAWIGK